MGFGRQVAWQQSGAADVRFVPKADIGRAIQSPRRPAVADARAHRAECLRGLEVNHQLEFGGCLNRQLAWFCALEDAIDIRRRTPLLIGNIRTVRDQAAGFRE